MIHRVHIRSREQPRPLSQRKRSPANESLRAGVVGLFLMQAVSGLTQEPAGTLAARAIEHEMDQIKQGQHLSFTSEEKSSRTGGHLWVEKVVVTEDGEVRRLVRIDGTPLSPAKAKEEDERVQKSLAHIEAARRRSAQEDSGSIWVRTINRSLIFSYGGQSKDGTVLRYRPNPEYTPANYKERIVHALEGTLVIREPQDRIAAVDAKVGQPVELGYGVLGRLEADSRLHVERSEEPGGSWQATRVELHILGRLLMLKNLSQDLEMVRSEYRDLPPHLTLQQAAEITRP